MNDPKRLQSSEVRDGLPHFAIVGSTKEQRILVVVWIGRGRRRYPIHAHPAGRKEVQEYWRDI